MDKRAAENRHDIETTGRLALAIDLERCIGCKSCEAACKQEHGLGPGEFRNRVVWLQDAAGPGLSFLPVMCQHCARPACLRACPLEPKAISKHPETGVVVLDEARCTGCGECVVACPYNAVGFDADSNHALKCDLCADRRADGLTTACASVCPGRAITLGPRADLVAEAESAGRRVRDHDNFLLGPATVILDTLHEAAAALSARTPDPIRPRTAPARRDAVYPHGAPRDARTPDRVERGGCNICFNSCSLKFHFKGDCLVRITGNDEDPVLGGRICAKSQMSLQLYTDPRRLKTPMKRVGKRGEGRFAPITWDEALDGIAARLTELRDKWGSESLAIFLGTRTGIMTFRGYAEMFAQMWGTPNIEGTDTLCASSKNVAYAVTQGTLTIPNSYTPADIGSAELYVYIGDNQGETRPVYFGMVNDWRIRNGARLVVADPRFSVTASKADKWLPIRSGTDMALALALAHHIFENDLHDRAFCEANVAGWEAWRDFIFEKGYSPDWAAPITDLAADDIRALARDIAAANGCMIFSSRGINQHSNGVQTNRALMFVAAITGNWGRKGGGFFNMTSGVGVSPPVPEDRRAPVTRPMVRRNPLGWVDAMRDGKPYPIRALVSGNNPLAQWPSQDQAREAFAALDLVVHFDLFENETSAYADYLLPAATGIEKGGINRANDDRRIVWNEKFIDPPGEAKSDGWFWIELGKRFGFGDVMTDDYKDAAVMWDALAASNPDLTGCTVERMRARPARWVRYPLVGEDGEEIETLFERPDAQTGKRFPTASGKLEFFTPALDEKFRAVGLSALPAFYSEREQLVDLPHLDFLAADAEDGAPTPFFPGAARINPVRINETGSGAGAELRANGFDMELISGRPPATHFHSWTHYAWQAQEMWPDLYAQIHPKRAADLGIEDGARVRIETAHGEIEAVAWLTSGIRERAVYIPIGWGERQPYSAWRSVNFLTDRTQRDPASDQVNLKTLLCRIERA